MDMSYASQFEGAYVGDAYERMFLNAARGDQALFVSAAELVEAWRIFTPLLHQIDELRPPPALHPFGALPEGYVSWAKHHGGEIHPTWQGHVGDHGATNGGWCSGGVDDCSMDDDPEFDAAACWGLCALKYPDSLVAIDLNEGSCCCQDKCECMANIEDGNYVYTDASITTLPANCGDDDDDDYFGPIPATCADAADSEFIRECRGGPVWQQDCVDEWHAYVECRWGYIPAIVDGTYTSGPSCSLSCADALSSPAPRPTNATALGSDAAAARGPLLTTAVLGAAAAAL